jgi:tRNA/rRNA methyltransferase
VPQPDLRVVLCQTRNPLNIGAAARATSNFGFRHLRVVNPYDPAFREAVSAVGGAPVLQSAESFPEIAGALRDCTLVVGTTAIGHRELQHPITTLADAAPLIRANQGPVALLFGSEKFGLSNDELAFCHHLIRIPTSPQTPSMNLGQAVAVCLYELIREPASPVIPKRLKPVEGSDAEQITRMLLEVLRESGYTNRIVATSIEMKVRRFVRRIRLTARDAPLVLGILRQILWRFRDVNPKYSAPEPPE